MSKLISFFLGLVLCASIAVAGPNDKFILMVYGDSLSSGYNLPERDGFVPQLERALTDKGYSNISVLNTSKKGETTSGGVTRASAARALNPDAIIIELGINDAFRQVPVKTIQENLEKIVVMFNSSGVPVMLVGMEAPITYPKQYQDDFRTMYKNVAHKYKLPLYPFFMNGIFDYTLGELNFNKAYLQADKAHPTAEGVQIMVKNIMPTVQQFLRRFQ